MKKIAVLNDISGFGRCSLTAALPIISAFGIQCCPMPTGVYSNQTGYESYKSVDLTDSIPAFSDEWKKLGARFDAIIVGFVTGAEQGKVLSDFIDDFGADCTVAVDPITADDGEIYDGFDEGRINAVKALAKKADILTPNLTELCVLTGREYKTDLTDGEILHMSGDTGAPAVITTGIRRGDKVVTAVYSDGEFSTVENENLGGSFSGTGDILVSYVTASVVNGTDIFDAVKKACSFIEQAIKLTLAENPAVPYRAEGVYFEPLLKSIV